MPANSVDPFPGKVGKCGEIFRRCEPLRLKAAHLALRSCTAVSRLTANNPTHCRIVAQTLGVIYILVSSEAPEHGLPQQADQCMTAVLAGARVGECFSRYCTQSQRVVEFAIGE